MDKIHDLFELEVLQVVEAFPSIYTKDNVVSLINVLRTKVLNEVADALSEANKAAAGITEEQFQEFAADISRKLESSLCNGNIEVYDQSSAEFGINYNNQIELENIDVLTDNITDELHDILLDQFQQHFGRLITDKSE
jgi:hypothetical protein